MRDAEATADGVKNSLRATIGLAALMVCSGMAVAQEPGHASAPALTLEQLYQQAPADWQKLGWWPNQHLRHKSTKLVCTRGLSRFPFTGGHSEEHYADCIYSHSGNSDVWIVALEHQFDFSTTWERRLAEEAPHGILVVIRRGQIPLKCLQADFVRIKNNRDRMIGATITFSAGIDSAFQVRTRSDDREVETV